MKFIKRLLLSLLLFFAPALVFGQIVHIQPTDPIQGSQVTLNNNFDYLANQITSGTVTFKVGGTTVATRPIVNFIAGNNVTLTVTDTGTAVNVQADIGPQIQTAPVTVPSSSSDTCTAGQWSADSAHYYFCPSDNTWVRSALSTWASVALPTFSPTSPYTGPSTSVTISDSTGSSTIKYCTDSNNTCDPSGGTTYSTPVSVSSTGYLRAYATAAGLDPSAVASWHGTIVSYISDTFTGTGALDSNWTDLNFTGNYAHLTIARASGVAQITSGGADWKSGAAMRTDSALGDDGWVQADFQYHADTPWQNSPIWRASNASSPNFYFMTFTPGDHITLYKVTSNSSRSYVSESGTAMSLSEGTWFTWRVEYTGNTFVVKMGPQGGTLSTITTFTDSSLASGKPGIFVVEDGYTPSYPVDNFEAQ